VGDALARVLPIAGISVGAATFVGAWLYYGVVAGVARRLGWTIGVVARPDPPPRQPIEDLAADVRRLGHAVTRFPPGCPMVRRRATLAAYDDALVDACRALDIGTTLGDLPDGLGKEIERLRVETDLRRAGFVIDDAA
jgi:hypothetical protein